ncbi:MAG: hypothetical protein U1E65_14780 [Myxococcota bacterium]
MRISILPLCLLASSCTVFLNQNTPPPPGGTPNPCAEGDGAPKAHVIFDVRIDRTVVNLAADYESFAQSTLAGLLAAGIKPTHAVFLDLTERSGDVHPLAAWGCELGTEPVASAVLRHYAQAPPMPRDNGACATTPAVTAGQDLSALVTDYPADLNGHSGRRIFGPAPELVLVVHLDSLPRGAGFDEAPCANDAAILTGKTPDALSTWLHYAERSDLDIPGVFQAHVFHWFLATDEGVSTEAFQAACRAHEDLPVGYLDILEPSPRALYGPLAKALNASGAHAESASLCAVLSPSGGKAFLTSALGHIASVMGTQFNPDLIAQILKGQQQTDVGSITGPR